MEKKRKKINVKFIVLILSLIVFLSMSIFTFAYFTDNKNYTGTLNFGELKLKVSGDSVIENSKTLSFDTARKLNNDSTWTGKYMPGDTINIKLKVGLEDGSEPAYYIVQISDDKNVFENAFYYSQNGNDVYVNNGQKIVKQNTTTEETDKKVGMLTAGDSNAHSLTISAKISEDFESQGVVTTVYCNIYAVQRANLEETGALAELLLNSSTDTNKKLYTQVEYLQSTGTQYLDTCAEMTNTSHVKLSILWTSATGRQLMGFNTFGAGYFGTSGDAWSLASNAEAIKIDLTNFQVADFYVLSTQSELVINNDTENKIVRNAAPKISGTFTLFSLGNDYYCKAKIKDCVIWNNNEIVRQLVPALRNSDNKPGMLDALSGIFYTNVGSGEFIYG